MKRLKRSNAITQIVCIIQPYLDSQVDSQQTVEIASRVLEALEQLGMEYIDNNYEHGWERE